MEEAAVKHADAEIEFIKSYFDDLTDNQLNILKIVLKGTYMHGYIHGSKDTNEMFKK